MDAWRAPEAIRKAGPHAASMVGAEWSPRARTRSNRAGVRPACKPHGMDVSSLPARKAAPPLPRRHTLPERAIP